MPTSLITGGAGFIGSHLAEALLSRGEHVYALDDFSSGGPANVQHLRHCERFHLVEGSIFDEALLQELMDQSETVYHLAATVGVFNILERPVRTIENNVGGTDSVLRAASLRRRKVILASTSEVYGKTSVPRFLEDGDLVLGESTKLRWGYAASKLVDEFMALAYWREFHLPVIVVRLFNTIGPRQSGQYGMVVPRFVQQALLGEPLTVFGTGTQSRCFGFVTDVTEWLCRLAADDRAVGQVFNLGNPVEITIADLARKVLEITGSGSRIEYVPYENAYEDGFEDMLRRVPSIDKVRTLTGYSPQVSLDQALELIRDSIVTRESLPSVAGAIS